MARKPKRQRSSSLGHLKGRETTDCTSHELNSSLLGGMQGGSDDGGGPVHKEMLSLSPISQANGDQSQKEMEIQPLEQASTHHQDAPGSSERQVRVYADGIYDLFHFGHARSLEQAKKLFPNTYLLVGCCSDELTHRYKGKTVFTDEERYESLRHCRWVDEVVRDAPWVITQDFLDKHKIDYVAHDALPYADNSGAGNDVYDFVKKAGRFKETKRTSGVSTSDVIMRILKDYNEYVMRNLSRGYTRKELGVSYVKEQQLRVNMELKKLRQRMREQHDKRKRASSEKPERTRNGNAPKKSTWSVNSWQLSDWMDNADRWVSGFLEKFEEGVMYMEKAIKAQLTARLLPKPKNKALLRKQLTRPSKDIPMEEPCVEKTSGTAPQSSRPVVSKSQGEIMEEIAQ
eukprot:TRINITY_DN1872_c0_g1_i1.p1 TRINITY_DN1872_c0_g1~~TRINITY_DN1872_c0_g1_i1.p1  ORF type:complete len:401 (+),score=77.12 TRINITY_DN1872_c0_g1_i1:151-1353(+)